MHCGFPNMSSVFPANRATCAYSRSPLAQFSASLSLPSLLRHPHSNPTEMANQCWSRRHTNRRSRGVGGRFVHIQSLYGKRREAALETRWLCLARPGSVCLSVCPGAVCVWPPCSLPEQTEMRVEEWRRTQPEQKREKNQTPGNRLCRCTSFLTGISCKQH